MPSIFISSVALFWKRMIFPSEVGKMIKSPIRLFLELNPAFTPGSRTIEQSNTVHHRSTLELLHLELLHFLNGNIFLVCVCLIIDRPC